MHCYPKYPKDLEVFFKSEGSGVVECQIDWHRICSIWCGVFSDINAVLVCCGEKRAQIYALTDDHKLWVLTKKIRLRLGLCDMTKI